MLKTLQVGLGRILRKISIIVSMSTQNLWFVSKHQNLSIRGSFEVFYEYLTYVLLNQTFSFEKCFGFAK